MRPRPRTAVGSSPLTRGKPQIVQLVGQVGGLIPAHAGKTAEMLVSISIGPAHPRSRGENALMRAVAADRIGSSPLTRGKRTGPAPCHHQARLIPAHAGKTSRLLNRGGELGAHPRSRGENWNAMRKRSKGNGSSPLTRGKPTCNT